MIQVTVPNFFHFAEISKMSELEPKNVDFSIISGNVLKIHGVQSVLWPFYQKEKFINIRKFAVFLGNFGTGFGVFGDKFLHVWVSPKKSWSPCGQKQGLKVRKCLIVKPHWMHL